MASIDEWEKYFKTKPKQQILKIKKDIEKLPSFIRKELYLDQLLGVIKGVLRER